MIRPQSVVLNFAIVHGGARVGLLGLRVRHVDLLADTLRLDPGTTKNDQGREVSMTRTVRELLTECVRDKRSEDPVFTRQGGRPVLDFRAIWVAVCCAAGVGELLCRNCEQAVDTEKYCTRCERDWTRDELKYRGLIFHDLRRTAVRNMVRAGVSERVAMSISGHKTRSVFDRYHIVAPSDLREAARKLDVSQEKDRETLQKSRAPEFGQSLGMVAPKLQQNRKIVQLTTLVAPLPN